MDGITDSMDMNLSRLRELVMDRDCVLKTNHKNKAKKMKQFMLSMKETVGAELRLPQDHLNA